LGDEWRAAVATLALGMSSLLEGANEQALSYFEEFVPVVRARGDRFWLISGLTSMAQAQHFLGRFAQARQNFGEALRLALEANDLASVTIALGPGITTGRSGCGPPPRRSSSGSVAAPGRGHARERPKRGCDLGDGRGRRGARLGRGMGHDPQRGGTIRNPRTRSRSDTDRAVGAGVSGRITPQPAAQATRWAVALAPTGGDTWMEDMAWRISTS
jgi:hypothetical protein